MQHAPDLYRCARLNEYAEALDICSRVKGRLNIKALLAWTGPVKRTSLHAAACSGNIEIVDMLLEHGANPNVTDKFSRTPLHDAAQDGAMDIVESLLRYGAKPNPKDAYGRTPMHLAAYGGFSEVLLLLMKYGAPTNSKAKNGRTPLHDAAAYGHAVCVMVLATQDSNLHRRDKSGNTALDLAMKRRATDVVGAFEHIAKTANRQSLLPDNVAPAGKLGAFLSFFDSRAKSSTPQELSAAKLV
eukprot:m.1615097 g.1615097  ORF g.1615097 m.1615097 type:complete len:243 (+) comp25371_c2_seq2:114-842(+)